MTLELAHTDLVFVGEPQNFAVIHRRRTLRTVETGEAMTLLRCTLPNGRWSWANRPLLNVCTIG